MFLTTGAAAALALHYDSQAVALLGLVGRLPHTGAALDRREPHVGSGRLHLLLNLGALAIARVKRWPALEYLAWVGTALLFLGWSHQWLDDETRLAAFELAVDHLRVVFRGERGGGAAVACWR